MSRAERRKAGKKPSKGLVSLDSDRDRGSAGAPRQIRDRREAEGLGGPILQILNSTRRFVPLPRSRRLRETRATSASSVRRGAGSPRRSARVLEPGRTTTRTCSAYSRPVALAGITAAGFRWCPGWARLETGRRPWIAALSPTRGRTSNRQRWGRSSGSIRHESERQQCCKWLRRRSQAERLAQVDAR